MVLDLHAEGAAVWGGGGSWSPNQEMSYCNPQKNIYICKFLQGGTPPVIRFYICWFITTINYIRCYKLVNKSHEYHIVIDQLN